MILLAVISPTPFGVTLPRRTACRVLAGARGANPLRAASQTGGVCRVPRPRFFGVWS